MEQLICEYIKFINEWGETNVKIIPAPLSVHLYRAPSRFAPPALVVWGLAGALMVLHGYMSISARNS